MTRKGKFLKRINEAFADNDTDFILQNVTDNIQWTIIGDQAVEGKESFSKALKAMEADEPMELTIDKIITHGKAASVNGEIKTAEGKVYAFCDVYEFSGFKNPKIKKMSSYVIETKE